MIRAPILVTAIVLNEVRGLFVAGPAIERVARGEPLDFHTLLIELIVGVAIAGAISFARKR